MSLGVKITGNKEFQLRIKKVRRLLPQNLAWAINRILVVIGGQVEKHLQNDYLKVRSGGLSGSFRIRPRATSAKPTATLGSPVRYANVHNDGFTGTVKVQAHERTSRRGNRFHVKTHNRKMRIRGTGYFDDAIKKKSGRAEEILAQAVDKSIR